MSTQTSAATPATQDPSATRAPSAFSVKALAYRPEAGALIGTLGVFVFFAIFGGSKFLAEGGTASWLNVAAELGIIAIPVGLLMIAGELDLSVGSVLAASSMTLAIVSGHWGGPMILGILLALTVGLGTGLLNGILVTRTNVPSFVVTLATNFGVAGLTLGLSRVITGTTSVGIKPDPLSKGAFGTLIGGQFEVAIFWWVGVALVVGWVLQMTKYGNWVLAVGGDPVSARACGIPTERLKIVLYVASGFGAALVGVIQTILYNGAQVANGQSFVFNSIIAVVVGGVLLTGGYGSVIGVILGTLILAAVLMNNTFRRLALSARAGKKA